MREEKHHRMPNGKLVATEPKFKRFTLLCGLSVKLKIAEIRRCMIYGGTLEFCFHHCPNSKYKENVKACPRFKRYVERIHVFDSHILGHLRE